MQRRPPQQPYGGGEAPPSGQLPPQFHQFPSNLPPSAFFHNPNDLLNLQNPNLFFPNTLPFLTPGSQLQNPSFQGHVFGFQPQQNPRLYPLQNPSIHGQTSGFHSQEHASNQNLGVPQSRTNSDFSIERISEQVVKFRREFIAGGNNVTAWKVSQSVLLALRSESWESLGFQMQEIPPLHSLLVTERKINDFIQCYVGVRSITTLYELELAICENEGVEHFQELELGPFLQHPLVIHYFSLTSYTKDVLKITSKDVLSRIHKFLNNHKYNEAKIDELLGSILENSLTSSEKLNVHIQSLGYVAPFSTYKILIGKNVNCVMKVS